MSITLGITNTKRPGVRAQVRQASGTVDTYWVIYQTGAKRWIEAGLTYLQAVTKAQEHCADV